MRRVVDRSCDMYQGECEVPTLAWLGAGLRVIAGLVLAELSAVCVVGEGERGRGGEGGGGGKGGEIRLL